MYNCHFTSFTLWGRNISLARGLHKTVFQTMPVYSIQGICMLFRLWRISHCIFTADLLPWGSNSCGCNEEKDLSILLFRAPLPLAWLISVLISVKCQLLPLWLSPGFLLSEQKQKWHSSLLLIGRDLISGVEAMHIEAVGSQSKG